MIGSTLKTAIRHIRKRKGQSFLKIFGLSLGIASCLLIYLFVADELSFDDFHENGAALFRLVQIHYDEGSGRHTGFQEFIPAPVGPELLRTVPDVVQQSRFVTGQGVVRYRDKVFSETLTMVDPGFLEMFTFPLVAGEPRAALADRHDLVLTRSTATKYFGDDDPIGRTLAVDFGRSSLDFVVTAVVSDPPRNSSLRFAVLVPFENLPAAADDPLALQDWGRWFCPLSVRLRPAATPASVAPVLDRFCRQYFGTTIENGLREGQDPFTFGLQNVRDLHLDTRFAGVTGLKTSYLLSAIALAILLAACVNFTNLSIGASSTRSVEVGVRKVLGAGRRQLLRQFWTEALLASSLALLLALLMTELLLPEFNALAGKELALATFFGGAGGLALLAVVFVTGVLAGTYPAAVMTAFPPAEVLKGKLRLGGGSALTRVLVVVQFALSVTLGISAVLLGRQVGFILNKDPGYASRDLVVVLTQENEPRESERVYRRFRNEALREGRVQGITASGREFGLFLPRSTFERGGREVRFAFDRVDPDFLPTMGLRLIEGRDFSSTAGADRDAIVVNERFVEALGPEFRLGELLGDPSRGFPYDRRVIGVVADCHFLPLRNRIEPLALYVGELPSPRRNTFSRIMVRVRPEGRQGALAVLESAWKKVRPDKPFLATFQEDALAGLYGPERRWSAIVRYASWLSLLLACLGIFGLTAVALGRREKEMGIRKVLGAGAGRIMVLATREFVLLISLANAIAWPAAYVVMRGVLAAYPYRIAITVPTFVLAWAGSVLVAVLTILSLAARVAFRNPVDSLRHE
jgi:putative ABC transport system permease protein